ncbi:MAG TPA: Crp/Fnr family transcriptional regulator [Steroidobacteraceae bacterium]|nr:Crp/Fnr family transcriptional regulator [Steroidobacteraceae bacterium]
MITALLATTEIANIIVSILSTAQNHLIELLPRKPRLRLLAICEPVELVMAQVLSEVGIPTRYVYFPTEGFISLVTPISGKPVLEVGMIGREGMLGTQLALGVRDAPLHALVQGPGAAWRIGAVAFRKELARNSDLQRGLNRYVYVMMMQLASAASCLRFHQIGPRLARWLLMTQDRAHSDRFHITHEFLAYMLGVRRVGVTTAASVLQRGGLIKYHRGEIQVLSRRGLEAAACSCYAADRAAYAKMLH